MKWGVNERTEQHMTPIALFLAVVIQDPGAAAQDAPPQATEAARPFIAQGLALYMKRRFRAAAREFEQAVEADPASAAAHFYLGYSLYKIAEPTRRVTPEKERSREHFARCFELDPGFVPTWRRPQ
jgi:hypothetical protein